MVRAKTKRGPSSFKSLPREHALALLAYALEDAEAKDADADAIAELRGLPLVPLADGSLGAFSEGGCISPDPDGRKTGPDGSAAAAAAACLHLSTDDEEARLLASLPGARGSLVDRFALATVPGLLDKMDALARGAAGRALGVRAVDAAALAALFLPNAMPRAWSTTRRGEAMERWCPPRDGIITPEKSTDEEHPSSAQLATLWRRLATLAPTPELMAPFEGAPLLPVDDGAALAPLTPHGAVVRGEGWSESASRALEALGVRRLAAEDPAGVAAAAHPLSPRYARPATAAGTLDSAVAAASRLVPPEELVEAEGTNGGGARAPVSAEARWRAAARRVPEGFETRGPDAPARRALPPSSAARAAPAWRSPPMSPSWPGSRPPIALAASLRCDPTSPAPAEASREGLPARRGLCDAPPPTDARPAKAAARRAHLGCPALADTGLAASPFEPFEDSSAAAWVRSCASTDRVPRECRPSRCSGGDGPSAAARSS